jgi:hypothetical protein
VEQVQEMEELLDQDFEDRPVKTLAARSAGRSKARVQVF